MKRKHTVHLYAVVCVKVCDVEAESREQAARIAADRVESSGDLMSAFNNEIYNKANSIDSTHYSDDPIIGALVDIAGDDEYRHTQYVQLASDEAIDKNYKSEVKCEN